MFNLEDASGINTFKLNHISNEVASKQTFSTKENSTRDFHLLDKKKYLDYSEIQTNNRGEKEKTIWKALQNSTVVVKSSNTNTSSIGAGTIVENGKYILTNYHVIEPNINNIYIAFKPKFGNNPSKNNFYKVEVVKYDILKDLALLKLDDTITKNQVIHSLKFADKSSLEVGEDIYNMGHPVGYFYTPGSGMIKNISNDFRWNTHIANYVIQHSIPSSAGNSGGPVVNDKLELIGIGAFTNTKGQNLNFAISSIDIKKFIQSPKKETQNMATSLNLLDQYIVKKGSIKEVNYGYIKAAKLDINQNGVIDALLFDKDNNGKWDLIKYDKNEDGIIEKVTNY